MARGRSFSRLGGVAACVVVLAAVALGACGAKPSKVKVRTATPGDLPPVELVVVYPVVFRWESSSEESYRKTADLLEGLGEGRRVGLLGPDEYEWGDLSSPELNMATNALWVARQLGVDAQKVVALKVRIERRLQSGGKQVFDASGNAAGQVATQELRFAVHAELWQYVPARLLIEATTFGVHDPFAEHPDWDRHPTVRDAVLEIGRWMAQRIAPLEEGAPLPGPDPGFTFYESATPALSYTIDKQPPLSEELSKTDGMMARLRLWNAYRYFHPAIGTSTSEKLSRMPPGLVVIDAAPTGPAKELKPGDLIISAGGKPAAHKHQLWRALRGAGSGPVPLEVRRGPDTLTVALQR